MSNSDWYSRRLQQQAPPAPRTATPPVTPPMRVAVQVPAQRPASVPQYAGHANLLDPNRGPNDQITMGEAVRLWRGGEATRREGDAYCPSCGSHLVFSRSKTSVSGHAPAPRCFSCGWNGVYEQGDQANWAI